MKARNLEIVSNDDELMAVISTELAKNPDIVEKIRGGKVKAAGAIVGAVMRATHGKADAAKVNALIAEMVAKGLN